MSIVDEKGDFVGAGSETQNTPDSAAPQSPSSDWRQELKLAVRSASQLVELLGLPPGTIHHTDGPANDFPVFAPRPYISRMQPGNPRDPLLLQVLPQPAESKLLPGFVPDAVGDLAAEKSPGLIQKYHGRALLITTGACAIHCRYCFRRHFPYETAPRSVADWEPALQVIRDEPSLDEVILSGGDPWTLVDETLAELIDQLAAIPHLKRLRIHTRLPIVIPQRVTDGLLAGLTKTRLTPIVVVHANHPQEIDTLVEHAFAKILAAGCVVLNQAVLLKGINDDVTTLAELSRRLVDLRVMPYYLHQLDRVQGAAHFEVPIERGQVLVDKLRPLLPGYAIPKYVQEVAGDPAKRGL